MGGQQMNQKYGFQQQQFGQGQRPRYQGGYQQQQNYGPGLIADAKEFIPAVYQGQMNDFQPNFNNRPRFDDY